MPTLFYRFSALPVYCEEKLIRCRSRFSQMPASASKVKAILKSKCCFHDILLIAPPQEQGSSGVKVII